MRTLFVATAGVETAPLANGSVVYNLKTGKFIMLNRTANRIWSGLARPRAEEDVVDSLRRSYPGLDAAAATSAVSEALLELCRLEFVMERRDGDERAAAGAQDEAGVAVDGEAYAPPSVKLLDEDDLLKVFQITAAEISVASCWWGACSVGCP
jgi:hypothetical protein